MAIYKWQRSIIFILPVFVYVCTVHACIQYGVAECKGLHNYMVYATWAVYVGTQVLHLPCILSILLAHSNQEKIK